MKDAEVRALEQRVLEDALDAAEGLDHVRAVVVQIPELAVVPLVRPPARVGRDVVWRRFHAIEATRLQE